MSITNVRKLLVNLAMKEDKESQIAKILAYYYPNLNFADKKVLFESILYYYNISDQTKFNFDNIIQEMDSDNDVQNFKGKDFRIKSIEISDVRGIPEKDKNGISFGIDFTDENQINNAIILANNGTGKSSIFSAIEMLYAQEIGEKQLRTPNLMDISKDKYDEYLQRFPSERKPKCAILTNEGAFDLENIIFKNERTRKLLNPSNHFISDFDIYHYGQKDFDGLGDNRNSFHSLIADSLGLGEFIYLQSILTEVSKYGRKTESNSLKKLEVQKLDSERNIKSLEEQVKLKKTELLKNKEISNQYDNAIPSNNKLNKLQEWINKKLDYNIIQHTYLEAIDKYNQIYKESLSISRITRTTVEKDFLNAGLELIHEFDNCPFCQSTNKSLEELQKNVEGRLEALKKYQQIDEVLRSSFRELTNILKLFYSNTSSVFEIINIERSEIVIFKELTNLSTIEENFYYELSPILYDDDLNDLLNQLYEKSYPNNEDYKKLFALINQDIIKSNYEIINKVSQFLDVRKNYLLNTLEKYSTSIDDNIKNQISIIESDINRLEKQIVLSRDQIESLNVQIQKLERDVALVLRIKMEISDFIKPLDSEINKLVNESFSPIQDTVESILFDYLKDESINFKIDRRESKTIVDGEEVINNVIIAIIECKDDQTGIFKTITPDIYFNTFRYKLFCLMVSLSLALSTRKKYNVNLPLVIDDLFFASDFVSKNSFAQFLQKVVSIFHKFTPNLPLQFILFTHDDLIFRSAIDAVDTFTPDVITEFQLCEENKKHLAEKTQIGRFFNPNDKDNSPSKFDDGKLYWNLLYKIPKSINELVKF